MMDWRVGDLALCRDNHYNRGLGIIHKIGMVVEIRRKDFRILFDADNQSIWLPRDGANRITLPPTDSPGFLDRLSWLVHFLDARECELELDEDLNYRYTVICAELSRERIHAVCSYMGTLLRKLRIVPRGMSRLGLELTFVRTCGSELRTHS
jgi:hypothetical protein